MAATIPDSLWPPSFGNALGRLRERGRTTLMEALGPAPAVIAPELVGLSGHALARHHLALAIDALRGPGTSKPQIFCELRLLINKFEQSTGRPEVQSATPQPSKALPPMSRRARLLSRAFESANTLAGWRAASHAAPQERRAA